MRSLAFLIGLTALLGIPAAWAQGATLTLPSITFTSPASTAITCTQTAAANLVVPVAAGTVIFSCSVAPSGWVGTVSASLAAPFAVSTLTGNTFNIIVSTAVTTANTVSPGSVTASP